MFDRKRPGNGHRHRCAADHSTTSERGWANWVHVDLDRRSASFKVHCRRLPVCCAPDNARQEGRQTVKTIVPVGRRNESQICSKQRINQKLLTCLLLLNGLPGGKSSGVESFILLENFRPISQSRETLRDQRPGQEAVSKRETEPLTNLSGSSKSF